MGATNYQSYLLELKRKWPHVVHAAKSHYQSYLLELKHLKWNATASNPRLSIVPVGIETTKFLGVRYSTGPINRTCWNWNLLKVDCPQLSLLYQSYLLELKLNRGVNNCQRLPFYQSYLLELKLGGAVVILAALLLSIVPVGIETKRQEQGLLLKHAYQSYLLELKHGTVFDETIPILLSIVPVGIETGWTQEGCA